MKDERSGCLSITEVGTDLKGVPVIHLAACDGKGGSTPLGVLTVDRGTANALKKLLEQLRGQP